MQNYSTTQITNLATFVGIVMLVLNHFHVNIAPDEIQALIGDILSVVGLAANWYHRYKKGDLTILGARTGIDRYSA